MNTGKTTIFTGAATAIITPFCREGVDYEAFGRIIDKNIEGGIDALVIAGTTGEGSTLSHEEHCEVLRFAYERIAGRVPAVAGTGSNDTAYGIELSKYAADIGYEGLLLVTPYYNKATPKGLIQSFNAIADAAKIPSILYNVPSRTGVNIPISVYKELAKNEYIVATKEASGNLSAIAELLAECGDSLDVYSGNDDQIVPILSLGGKGVISVLSNVMPKETHDICALWFEGKVKESAALQLRLLDLVNALFCEVNPIPVKAAMEMLGYCGGDLRLPLCEIDPINRERLRKVMQKHKLL